MRKIMLIGLLMPSMCFAQLIDELSDSGSNVNAPMNTGTDLRMIQRAFDSSKPNQNTVVYQYDPQHTYKVRLREFTKTVVILPDWEKIKAWDIGDPLNFRFVPMISTANMGSLQMINPGADTSLAVIGESGLVYTFYIRADSVKSQYLPHFMVYIRGDAPDSMQARTQKAGLSFNDTASTGEYLRELPEIDPTKLRYDYHHSNGPNHITPIRVFDDGLWTYFQFGKDNLDYLQSTPALYRVLDGVDTPVNTRVVNGFIVAEITATGWTIRAGDAYICVRRTDHVTHQQVASSGFNNKSRQRDR